MGALHGGGGGREGRGVAVLCEIDKEGDALAEGHFERVGLFRADADEGCGGLVRVGLDIGEGEREDVASGRSGGRREHEVPESGFLRLGRPGAVGGEGEGAGDRLARQEGAGFFFQAEIGDGPGLGEHEVLVGTVRGGEAHGRGLCAAGVEVLGEPDDQDAGVEPAVPVQRDLRRRIDDRSGPAGVAVHLDRDFIGVATDVGPFRHSIEVEVRSFLADRDGGHQTAVRIEEEGSVHRVLRQVAGEGEGEAGRLGPPGQVDVVRHVEVTPVHGPGRVDGIPGIGQDGGPTPVGGDADSPGDGCSVRPGFGGGAHLGGVGREESSAVHRIPLGAARKDQDEGQKACFSVMQHGQIFFKVVTRETVSPAGRVRVNPAR